MKRILLAVGLGLGILTVTMADAANYTTAPYSLKYDTVPSDTTPTDTTSPTPTPDTSSFQIKH